MPNFGRKGQYMGMMQAANSHKQVAFVAAVQWMKWAPL